MVALALLAGGVAAAAPRYLKHWQFDHDAQGWRLSAPADGGGRALWKDGALELFARMGSDAGGQPTCPASTAQVAFGDATSRRGGDRQLDIRLEVQRWDLGLGPMDAHLPRLEVRHHGLRSEIGVAGFTRMPGQVELQWRQAQGWRIRFDGGGAWRELPAVQTAPDSGAPQLRLSIDGCSQGMRQWLRLASVSVSAD